MCQRGPFNGLILLFTSRAQVGGRKLLISRRRLCPCRLAHTRSGRTLWLVLLLALIAGAGIVLGSYGWTEYEYRSALVALERHDLAQAQEHLSFFLRIRPHNAQVRLLAARVALMVGDHIAIDITGIGRLTNWVEPRA